METTVGRNMPGMKNNTRPRDFAAGIALNGSENDRSARSALPQTFANTAGWGGSIWNSSSLSSALGATTLRDAARTRENGTFNSTSQSPIEGMTGSASLVATSESDPWNSNRSPWGDSTAAAGNTTGVSPVRRKSTAQTQPAQFSESSPADIFASSRGLNLSQEQVSRPSTQRLDPTTMNFAHNGQPESLNTSFPSSFAFGPSNATSQRGDISAGPWSDAASVHSPSDERGPSLQEYWSPASASQSRSGSLPPSRHGEPAQFPSSNDHFPAYTQPPRQHSSFSQPNGRALQERSGSIQSDSIPTFSRLSLGQSPDPAMFSHRASLSINGLPNSFTPAGTEAAYSRDNYMDGQASTRGDDTTYVNPRAYTPDQGLHRQQSDPSVQFRQFQFDTRSAPTGTAARQSPFYSHAHTPPVYDHLYPSRSDQALSNGNNMAFVTSKLQGYQQQQQERRPYINPAHLQPHPLQQMYTASSLRNPYGYPNFIPNGMHMNGLAQTVPVHVVPQVSQMVVVEPPRAPRDHNQQSEGIMGKTLFEYKQNRSNSNKRYELKDIFGDVVEFSGDQHGSRFIQQKIETANSDEKDRVFKELQPNALQLMQDVFGNYVIQKFFEHGDQTQKKILASRMKGHVFQLSKQMYGCRVVQKALEHILTDQQAELIKELDKPGAVLECVRDQNGNHVIQKAVERVPAEHIQFIVKAFEGQVHTLAVNSYGCRVIQRMLEYCEAPAKRFIMEELHEIGSKLITDSYGNYVTQHIIEHGTPQDRAKIMELVKTDLFTFSKHKHASNVVEKSLMRATDEERREIMLKLVEKNERGESHVPVLIKDNYGNYVIQRVLDLLSQKDYDEMVSILKPEVEKVKKVMSGKQLIAIEKKMHRFERVDSVSSQQRNSMSSVSDLPPLSTSDAQSPQSSSLPSGNNSTIDDPVHTTPTANKALPSPGINIETA